MWAAEVNGGAGLIDDHGVRYVGQLEQGSGLVGGEVQRVQVLRLCAADVEHRGAGSGGVDGDAVGSERHSVAEVAELAIGRRVAGAGVADRRDIRRTGKDRRDGVAGGGDGLLVGGVELEAEAGDRVVVGVEYGGGERQLVVQVLIDGSGAAV